MRARQSIVPSLSVRFQFASGSFTDFAPIPDHAFISWNPASCPPRHPPRTPTATLVHQSSPPRLGDADQERRDRQAASGHPHYATGLLVVQPESHNILSYKELWESRCVPRRLGIRGCKWLPGPALPTPRRSKRIPADCKCTIRQTVSGGRVRAAKAKATGLPADAPHSLWPPAPNLP